MYRPGLLFRLRDRIAPALLGPPALAFLPALSLGAFWLGGEPVLILVSLGLPLVVAVAQAPGPGRDRVTGLLQGPGFERVVERVHAETAGGAQRSACVLLELEEFGDLAARHGTAAAEEMARLCGRRIRSVLRTEDTAARLGETRFGICLAAIAQLDLENCIQLAGRLQAAVEEPAALDGTTVYLSCSIGFCLRSRAPGRQPGDWIAAAEAAMGKMGQGRLFQLRPGQDDLDAALAERGYAVLDPVTIYACPVEQLCNVAIPRVTALTVWEPLAIMREIWLAGGIGPARVEIMHRAAGPKTGLLGRHRDKPAGAAFAAIHDGIAMVHAVEVLAHQRRAGIGRWFMRAAALWARDNGARTLSVMCTDANRPANALYASLGMAVVGHYHYRRQEERSQS
ncbi:hypothetical protein CVM52_24595 [Pseudooceanicola lipolyticus]|uniref:GNAT family N-acetyltransferase n=1 Tax=Pseudooceanicola lipolyticus TaxID=2029104 RepID=A0A2M8ITY4_9RHOB|nr:GNAT family N-acetyltransferase [Pseudooceanicola lipolyticus]PJE33989.1 hypothetical protein CVM52_24595 [Pseudooceanicola lipolyticus]